MTQLIELEPINAREGIFKVGADRRIAVGRDGGPLIWSLGEKQVRVWSDIRQNEEAGTVRFVTWRPGRVLAHWSRSESGVSGVGCEGGF